MRFADSKSCLFFFLLSSLTLSACGSDDDPPAQQAPTLGWVIATQGPQNGQFVHSISASFFDDAPDTSSATCTTRKEGTCAITKCNGAADDGGESKSVPAGTLTVSGGLLTPPGIVLEPDAENLYGKANVGKAWDAGQKLAVKSTGAQVPAFELSVSTPDTVTLEAPAFPSADRLFKRSAGLELRWAGPKETKYVSLDASDTATAGHAFVSLTCTFAAEESTSNIPASVLGELPAGQTRLYAWTQNEATILVNGKTVALQARANARTPSGDAADRYVTLE